MAQGYFSGINMQRYEEEDSDHSVNGWIKKEVVEEDEEMDDYLKQGQDTDPSDHYESLLNLSKEELIGKILQLEEDVRYLRDIRNGFDKSVQELNAMTGQQQTLTDNMLNVLSSLNELKEQQQQVNISTVGDNTMPVSSTMSASRSDATRGAETSPGSTPSSSSSNVVTALASPKMVPPRNNTRLTEQTTQSFMSSSNILPAKERAHVNSVNAQSTVTITRSTNVVIKTEIPSPPPEPEIIENPMEMSHNMALTQMSNYPKKRKYENQSFQQQQQQHHQQQHPISSTNINQSSFSPIQTTAQRSTSQRAKVNVNMPVPQQHSQQRARMNPAAMQSGPRGSYPMQQNVQTSIRSQRPVQVTRRMPTPRFAHNSPRMSTRGRGNVQDVTFSNQMQRGGPCVQQPTMSNTVGRPRQASTVKITPMPTTTSSSPVHNVLADFAAKMPHISLSIVPQGSTAQKNSDSGSRGMVIKPTDNVERSSAAMAPTTFTNSMVKADGKNVTSSHMTIPTSSSSQAKVVNPINISFGDEEEDENDYDEIAVLIPDKKTRIVEDDSDPASKNSQGMNKKKTRGSEMFVSQESYSTNWTQQSPIVDQSNQNTGGKIYNNDEYMFDDPLDDTDIEENDSKFYLGEDVNLPKEVVDNCIKSCSNGDQLTQKLMEALFPDLAQVAASCNVDGNKAHTILPSNKVNAIIGLVQQRFPLKTRKDILAIVNGKFQEAKLGGNRNRTRGVQFKQY